MSQPLLAGWKKCIAYTEELGCPELEARSLDFCKSNSSDGLGSQGRKLASERSGV